LGDRWVAEEATAILEVPSAVISIERNYILNPLHKDFDQVQIGPAEKFEFDSKLVKLWNPGQAKE
jgi:RES domain-containing protein